MDDAPRGRLTDVEWRSRAIKEGLIAAAVTFVIGLVIANATRTESWFYFIVPSLCGVAWQKGATSRYASRPRRTIATPAQGVAASDASAPELHSGSGETLILRLVTWTMFGVLAIFAGIGGLMDEASQGPRHCRTLFKVSDPDAFAAATETGAMWTRTQGKEWITALVFQPNDVSRKPFTIVCRYPRDAYVSGKTEVFDGDVRDRLTSISSSNQTPVSYLKRGGWVQR